MSRFNVTVFTAGSQVTFKDATFSVGEAGVLQVNQGGNSLYVWAPGQWTRVFMVPENA